MTVIARAKAPSFFLTNSRLACRKFVFSFPVIGLSIPSARETCNYILFFTGLVKQFFATQRTPQYRPIFNENFGPTLAINLA